MALAKKLKKNNVAVDIISFGEHEENEEKLAAFISTVENNENSHLLTVPVGAGALSDTLISSPIVTEANEEQSGSFQFGVDPNMDPELAMVRIWLQQTNPRPFACRSRKNRLGSVPLTTTRQRRQRQTRLRAQLGRLCLPMHPRKRVQLENTPTLTKTRNTRTTCSSRHWLSRAVRTSRWIPSQSSLEQLLLA